MAGLQVETRAGIGKLVKKSLNRMTQLIMIRVVNLVVRIFKRIHGVV